MKRERIEEIDIIKAIAIVLMVLGHSGFRYTSYIFMFHMAVFFIASGYTYKPESSDSFENLKKSTLKKLKRLWLPFFLWNTLFTLLNNWLIQINFYTDNPELFAYTDSIVIMNMSAIAHYMSPGEMAARILEHFLFIDVTAIAAPIWFLKTLFHISFLFTLTDWIIKKTGHADTVRFQAVLSVLLLGVGYWCGRRGIRCLGLERAASNYYLFFFGTLFSRYRHRYSAWRGREYLLTLLASSCILLILFLHYKNRLVVDLAKNKYPNPFSFFLLSLAGWTFCYSVSWFLKQTCFRSMLIYIGKRTMCIMILHYLAFKIVNAVIVSARHLPAFCLAAIPHLYGDSGWRWLAFTAGRNSLPPFAQYDV